MSHSPKTIVDAVVQLTRRDPERLFAAFDTMTSQARMTYGDLYRQGRRVASSLSRSRVSERRVVIIMLPQGPELMAAFFGTMLAGDIPTLFPTNDSRVQLAALRQSLEGAVATTGAGLLITDEASKTRFFADSEPPLPVITPAEWVTLAPTFTPPTTDADSVAFLQHSSGTTGKKKGVAITHRALLAQTNAYARSIGLGSDDVIASWLPLYHDMGLIACLLMPMVRGVPVVTLDPFEWVSSPATILRAISRERATLAWFPNFAYLFLAKRVKDEELRGVRLDSLRALVNCAEPITAEAHQAFVDRFAPLGFSASALSSCYAMAENTFAVTQAPVGRAPRVIEGCTETFLQRGAFRPATAAEPSRRFVSSGAEIENTRVRVVDPDTRQPCPETHVGEIALQSDSMLDGYFHARELDAEAITEGWYHTGDLGFLHEGELFVTGRKKDLIIVAGKNLYPQDIENIAGELPGVHPGRVVAFGLFDEELGTEQLIVLAETKEKGARSRRLPESIRAAITDQLQCAVHRVTVVPHGSLLKSTSGKISRAKCQDAFVRGEFDDEAPSPLGGEFDDEAPDMAEVDLRADASSAVKRVYPLAAALELLLQFASLALPVLLLLTAPTQPLLFTIYVMIAFYGYVLTLLALVGGLSRVLPKPQPGALEGNNLARWALLISIHMLARRGPTRWYGWCLPPGQLYLRLCGARVAADVMISSLDDIPEPYMVTIGAGTTLGSDCLVSAHYVPRIGTANLGPITIGKNVLVGRGASVWGNVAIGDGAVVQERSSVMPGTVIPPGEIWGGIPARPLLAQPPAAPRPPHHAETQTISNEAVDAFIRGELLPGSEARIDPSIALAQTGAVDSLSYLGLIQRLEERFGVTLDPRRFSFRDTSIDDLARAATKSAGAEAPLRC